MEQGICRILEFRAITMKTLSLKRYETQSVALSEDEQLVLGIFAIQTGESMSSVMRALMYKGLNAFLTDKNLMVAHDNALEILTHAMQQIEDDPDLRSLKSIITSRKQLREGSPKRRHAK